jgi:hypothetical protein
MTSMAFMASAPGCFQGTTTLSIKIFSTVAFSMTTVGISTGFYQNDILHNDTEFNNPQYENTQKIDTQHNIKNTTLSIKLCCESFAQCLFALGSLCYYSECHCAECRGAVFNFSKQNILI